MRTLLPRTLCGAMCVVLAACAAPPAPPPAATHTPTATSTPLPTVDPRATPLPTRFIIAPGQRLPYLTQTGDTVMAIAAHFNTTMAEIAAANPQLSLTATLPSGMAIEVPAYYFPLGGPAFKIIPDSEFVYGPATTDFDVRAFLQSTPGYLRTLSAYAAERQRTAADVITYVAQQYSLNPKLLLALMEWRTGALTQAAAPPEVISNPYALSDDNSGFYLQSLWVAEQLSLGYYGWRAGTLTNIPLRGTYTSRVDMYQNAGTVGVQYLLGQLTSRDEFDQAAGPQGFAPVYYGLWGNPFADGDPPDVILGDLTQPALTLPFAPNQQWALTGGPHPGWGRALPWSALDFAPPTGETGCINSDRWVTAAAPGVVARANDHTLVLDLDGDGYEQTGWVLFHFHMADRGLIASGAQVSPGDLLGHPSCEGGQATGTHVHIARKYNGEWIPADGLVPGVVPFDLGGWIPQRGSVPYLGRLTRLGAWVEACTCSTAANKIYWVP